MAALTGTGRRAHALTWGNAGSLFPHLNLQILKELPWAFQLYHLQSLAATEKQSCHGCPANRGGHLDRSAHGTPAAASGRRQPTLLPMPSRGWSLWDSLTVTLTSSEFCSTRFHAPGRPTVTYEDCHGVRDKGSRCYDLSETHHTHFVHKKAWIFSSNIQLKVTFGI